MNIKTWFLENKLAASLAGAFVLGTAGLGYLAWSSWNDYAAATDDYNSKASELDRLSHKAIFPSSSNLENLGDTLKRDRSNLSKLRSALEKYRIPSFGEIDKGKPQDQPQQFQDTLRKQVTSIKSLADSSGSTLPTPFYLGLDEYENQLPKPEQVPGLSKQLTVLNWLSTTLASQNGEVISQFSLNTPDNPDSTAARRQPSFARAFREPVPTTTSYETIASILVTLRCDQTSFRKLVNSISTAPYFLVIEDLRVQNTVGEPPRRDAVSTQQPADSPPDASTPTRLPIVVGRESLNVTLKIRVLDFPASQNHPEASK